MWLLVIIVMASMIMKKVMMGKKMRSSRGMLR